MISKHVWWIGKNVGRSGYGLICMIMRGFVWQYSAKWRRMSQNSRTSGRYFKQRPPEYEEKGARNSTAKFDLYYDAKKVHPTRVHDIATHMIQIFVATNPLDQRSPTGGPRTTDGPRENVGGPWRNLDIICNFYVYYTYFKPAATNITLIILL
jgi:hypothetical protein